MAPLPPDVAGSRVEVVGGKYAGSTGQVVGETTAFWDIRLSDGEVRKSKKSNVRVLEGLAQSDVPVLGSSTEAPPERQPDVLDGKRHAVLRAHRLSIATWNANKLSFMSKRSDSAEEMRQLVGGVAAELQERSVEVLVLQEVPKRQGPQRVWELREALNRALLEAGAGQDRLFREPIFSEESQSREIHAVLLREPVQLEQSLTLPEIGGVRFKHPPLVAVLRDDRFSFPALRRLVVVSAHTPGSSDRERVHQRARELNRLLVSVHSEVASRLSACSNSEVPLFGDSRARGKVRSASACAAPFVLCGDLNVNLYKPTVGIPPDLHSELLEGIEVHPAPAMNSVAVTTRRGCWVAGAPPGCSTSVGGRCLDWFLWNADLAKRVVCSVTPMRLSDEAAKQTASPGLSDHDALVLELTEDVVHAHQRRRGASCRSGAAPPAGSLENAPAADEE